MIHLFEIILIEVDHRYHSWEGYSHQNPSKYFDIFCSQRFHEKSCLLRFMLHVTIVCEGYHKEKVIQIKGINIV